MTGMQIAPYSAAARFEDVTALFVPGYTRQASRVGGDVQARTQFGVSPGELDRWLDYVGYRFIETHAGVPVFSGQVSRVMVNFFGHVVARSLDGVFNSVQVRYKTSSGAAESVTSAVQDATSIAQYGRRDLLYKPDVYLTTISADALAAALLMRHAYPRVQSTQLAIERSGQGSVRIEVAGWSESLTVNLYQTADTSSVSVSTEIGSILTATAASVVAGRIEQNLTDVVREADYVPAWDRLRAIAAVSDTGGVPYFIGCHAAAKLDYYALDINQIDYTVDITAGRTIHDTEGRVVPPALVKPGRTLLVRDILLARPMASNVIGDPRVIWIDSVTFTPRGGVQIRGASNEAAQLAALELRYATPPELLELGDRDPVWW